MKQSGGHYGAGSLFRKKRRDTSNTTGTSASGGSDTTIPASSLSPPDVSRPATASAHSRRGSRNSSIGSINEVTGNAASLRRRSTSLRKHAQASASSDMLTQVASRDASMSIRPSTATQDSQPSIAQPAQRVQSAGLVLHRLQDLTTKRIQTLDYLKKAHDGKTYWVNTLFFDRHDLPKLPYFDQLRLTRRAVNYFMLGNSLPAVLDPNKNNLIEYLRAFNALLNEFETFSNNHPADGSNTGPMSRMRVGRMFSRPSVPGARTGRRGSGIEGLSLSAASEDGFTPTATYAPFPGSDRELASGESYNFLLTPSLPFEPDYFETFATLCDVLIDCYYTILSLVQSPENVPPAIEDLFSKADMKVKKLLITQVVRDFEMGSKQGLRTEVAGVGKIVVGSLMG